MQHESSTKFVAPTTRRAGARRDVARWPAWPIQYADYAAWQRHWLEARREGPAARATGWTRLGGEQPVLQLPADHPRRAGWAVSRGAACGSTLPAGWWGAATARADARRHAVHGAADRLPGGAGPPCTDQADIRVGVPVANRAAAGDRTGGRLLRQHAGAAATASPRGARSAQVLDQAREAALGAQAHPDLPFEQLVEALPAGALAAACIRCSR